MNKLRRRSSRSGSDSDATEECDSVEEEEIAELPIISQEGHYWIGKDYSNTYKADFKDVADFSRGIFTFSSVIFFIFFDFFTIKNIFKINLIEKKHQEW